MMDGSNQRNFADVIEQLTALEAQLKRERHQSLVQTNPDKKPRSKSTPKSVNRQSSLEVMSTSEKGSSVQVKRKVFKERVERE